MYIDIFENALVLASHLHMNRVLKCSFEISGFKKLLSGD